VSKFIEDKQLFKDKIFFDPILNKRKFGDNIYLLPWHSEKIIVGKNKGFLFTVIHIRKRDDYQSEKKKVGDFFDVSFEFIQAFSDIWYEKDGKWYFIPLNYVNEFKVSLNKDLIKTAYREPFTDEEIMEMDKHNKKEEENIINTIEESYKK